MHEPDRRGRPRKEPISSTDLNVSVIPDGVPENFELLVTPTERLRQGFRQYAREIGAEPIRSNDEDGLDRAGTVLLAIEATYRQYRSIVPDKSLRFPLETRVEEMYQNENGATLLLVDVNDNFYGVVPDKRVKDDLTGEMYYEKLEQPVRMFVLATPARDHVIVKPMFSPEAFENLLQHARTASGWLASSLREKVMKPHDLDLPCSLFTAVMSEVDANVERAGGATKDGVSQFVGNIERFEVDADGQFHVDVEVERFQDVDGKAPVFLGSFRLRHHVTAYLDEFGFLKTHWGGVTRLQDAQQRKAA